MLVPGVLAAAGVALFATARRRRFWMSLGLTLAFFGSGAMLWSARHAAPVGDALAFDAAHRPASTVYTLEGTVERPDILLPGGDYMQFTLRVDGVTVEDAQPDLPGGVLVRWSGPGFALYSGDRIRIVGPLELDISRVNPGVGGVEDHYRRRGVHSALRLRGENGVERIEVGSSFSPSYWASRLRSGLAARLIAAVPEESVPFVLTVWLGDRRRMTDATYTKFLESGTAHILAVSGIHLGIVFMTVSQVLRVLVPQRRLRAYITIVIVLLFALMAGARVSSLRAAIMIALYLAGDLFDREPDVPTALSLAAILFTVHDPDAILGPGFQLSFLCIASILVFSAPLGERLRWVPPMVREAVATTLSVQILPLPVAITLFHVVPFAGILLNLIVVPLLTIVLWLSFLTSATAFVFPPVATLFGHAMHPFIMLILWLVHSVSDLGASHRYLPAPAPLALAFYACTAGLLLMSLRAKRHRLAWAAAAACALVVTIAFWKPLRPEAEVTFLDVGHGDAAFIRSPGGSTLLIDAGDRSGFVDMGRRVVGPYLWSRGVSRLDALIISHPDRDHIGGAAYILDHFSVGAVFLGPRDSGSPEERELLEKCERMHIPVKRLARGDTIELRGAKLEVLHPPEEWPSSLPPNENSLSVRVVWPGLSALFPGDAEAAAETALTQRNSTARILKVPHHGSRTSSSQAFIDAVRPGIAVISVGRRGRRSVLSPDVVRRYQESDATVFRTDVSGGIRITTRDGQIIVHSARADRGYPMRVVH
ncbi:MAG: DNA internalization-related competence protein ComEC/Rec2 [Candidatus Hydrogenedentes bacterium]|nr:DNA internalization-related competence protein ComEC/Rec2 [Candidatus Hydrogenedentota bacterium]